MRRPQRNGPVSAVVLTLAELLSGEYRFRLPWFQRAYAWRVDNVGLLLTNLRDAMRLSGAQRNYLLGSILLADGKQGTVAAVVDGHQRIMTLTILFAVLRDLMRDVEWRARLHAFVAAPAAATPKGDEELPHLVIDAELAKFVRRLVQSEGGTAEDPEVDLLSLSETERNIIENRDYLKVELGAADFGEAQRQELATFLAEHCRIIVHMVENEEEAWHWLQVEEDTRLDFSAADRSKASIISAMPAPEREEAGRIWEDCKAEIGAQDMRALLGHVRAIARHERSSAPVESELILHFVLNETGLPFLREHMLPMAQRLARLRERRVGMGSMRADIGRSLEHLSWIDPQIWVAPALQWLTVRGEENATSAEFFRLLERLFWVMRIAGTDPSVQQTRMFRLVEQVGGTEPPSGMAALRIESKVKDAAVVNLRSINFQAKHYSSHVLRRISVALGKDPGPVDGKKVTVEHVLPRNPAEDAEWWKHFGKSKPIKSYVNRLGNLGFLTEPLNQRAAAQDYAAKRAVFEESDDPLIRHALGYAEWTPETIEHRTRELMRILLEQWDLKP